MSEHRVPMLGGALRRRTDPSKSTDPVVRELVAALATLDVAPAPRADFRAELRAQLVAVTPRLVEEGKAEVPAAATPAAEPQPERSRIRLKKPLIALVGAMAAFIVLLGGAVLLSRDALPGDALYGVKRASEDTQYSLTGGSVDKGKLKLEFAGRRIDEVADLLHAPAAMAAGVGAVADSGGFSAETSKLARQTLSSANGDVRTASQLLGGAAVHQKSVAPLNAMTNWAPDQITAMRAIVARIPTSDVALHGAAVATLNLLERAQQRAAALKPDLTCSCLATSGTDRLGPLPCSTGCSASTPGSSNPTHPSTPGATKSARSGSHAPSTPGTTTAPGGGATKTTAPAPATSSGAPPSQPGVPITTKPHAPGLPSLTGLPTLPNGQASSTPILPIGVDTCGVHATLGPIGIGIGGC